MSKSNNTTQIFTADVIHANTKDWSTVVGGGGGYFAMPVSISTYHRRITEMWVRLSDGRETRIDFSGDFPVLPGHRIAFLATATHIWAARNFNTGNIYWLASIDWLAGKFRLLAHWIMLAGFLPAIFCGFLIKEFRLPYLAGNTVSNNIAICLITLAVIAIGIDAMRYLKHRKRVAAWQALINEGNAKLLNATYSAVPPALSNFPAS